MIFRLAAIAIAAAVLAAPVTSAPAVAKAAQAADMTQQNKMLLREFYQKVWTGKDYAWFKAHVTPGIVDHNPPPNTSGKGVDTVVETFKMMHAAFPDLKVTVDDMVAEGDKVVARYTMTGTNKGPMMGHPATGKKATWTGIDIIRFENGKAADRWGVVDHSAMMMELMPMDKHGQDKHHGHDHQH